ncbi:hypothetical protein HD596_008775 [Nonomuraea jabiensis]|uniref:Tn3 transposase DDE domain-containing protein n=1 Tax=Nonomuraea jabiensis TaxID=882448 RepID=A0A7W9GDX2_9ACTN|nr:hypothetical protein [Nonomuraea jabiensis]
MENYAELRKPLDPADFIAELKAEMRAELEALDTALPKLDWLAISERKSGAIKLTKLGPADEPRNLRRIKNEVGRRWGSVPLIDMLKEAVLRTGCLKAVTSVAGTSSLKPEVLAERLMLAIFGYGTNTGIRAVASGGHAHSEDDIRYVRRRYLTPQVATDIAIPSRTPPSPPGTWRCGARGRPRSPPTPRTCAPTIRIFSLSGTPGTAAAASSSTGTSNAGPWWCTPRPCAPRPRRCTR